MSGLRFMAREPHTSRVMSADPVDTFLWEESGIFPLDLLRRAGAEATTGVGHDVLERILTDIVLPILASNAESFTPLLRSKAPQFVALMNAWRTVAKHDDASDPTDVGAWRGSVDPMLRALLDEDGVDEFDFSLHTRNNAIRLQQRNVARPNVADDDGATAASFRFLQHMALGELALTCLFAAGKLPTTDLVLAGLLGTSRSAFVMAFAAARDLSELLVGKVDGDIEVAFLPADDELMALAAFD